MIALSRKSSRICKNIPNTLAQTTQNYSDCLHMLFTSLMTYSNMIVHHHHAALAPSHTIMLQTGAGRVLERRSLVAKACKCGRAMFVTRLQPASRSSVRYGNEASIGDCIRCSTPTTSLMFCFEQLWCGRNFGWAACRPNFLHGLHRAEESRPGLACATTILQVT